VHLAAGGRWRAVASLVFVVGFGLRIGTVLGSRGGAFGNFGYDPGVYYAASDALIHGRLPYRDFVLLHPPVQMLALTPFAVLGRLTTDHAGFVVANTAFAALGALNATLIVAVARRMGMSLTAAALGGLFYAVWYGAVTAEISARLEPLGTFAFLCGVFALTAEDASRRRPLVLAGAALGVAVSTKVWWIVPLLMVLAWRLESPTTRRGIIPLAAGAAAAITVINLPFFVLAPGRMWRMVVTDQLHRPTNTQALDRLDRLTSLHAAFPQLSRSGELVALAAIAALIAAVGWAAWRWRPGRMLVAIAAAQVVVLMASPSYFAFYSGYPAAALSFVVAAAAQSARGTVSAGRLGTVAAGLTVTLATALTGVALLVRPINQVIPLPARELAKQLTGVHCLMADSPMALIALNRLSSDLAAGCPNWIDVTGRTYDADAPTGRHTGRLQNAKWQVDVRRYLLSGDAVIVIRGATGLSPATARLIRRLPVQARAGGYVVHRTRP
jgi:hypothetical protein